MRTLPVHCGGPLRPCSAQKITPGSIVEVNLIVFFLFDIIVKLMLFTDPAIVTLLNVYAIFIYNRPGGQARAKFEMQI